METNQLLINYYKKEELKKAKKRYDEGVSKEEIVRLSNKEYITEKDIREALGISEDNEKETEKVEEQKHILEKQPIAIENEIKNLKEVVKIEMIEIDKLEDYPEQPFNLYTEDKRNEMIESIRINGIIQPLIVQPIKDQKYQILAGHNRKKCAKEIGLKEVPCIIKENLSEDEAKIYLIDTNLCTRENISPMERARAYRIKYDTYKKRKIQTSMMEEIKKDNLGLARATMIREEKSSNGTIQRYLRLTYLIPKLQEAIEQDKIKINTGEKLSFLPQEEQKSIAKLLDENAKISDNIAKRIRIKSEKIKQDGKSINLSKEEIENIILKKDKLKSDCIKIIFYRSEIEEFFKNKETEKQIKQYILEKLKESKTY